MVCGCPGLFCVSGSDGSRVAFVVALHLVPAFPKLVALSRPVQETLSLEFFMGASQFFVGLDIGWPQWERPADAGRLGWSVALPSTGWFEVWKRNGHRVRHMGVAQTSKSAVVVANRLLWPICHACRNAKVRSEDESTASRPQKRLRMVGLSRPAERAVPASPDHPPVRTDSQNHQKKVRCAPRPFSPPIFPLTDATEGGT